MNSPEPHTKDTNNSACKSVCKVHQGQSQVIAFENLNKQMSDSEQSPSKQTDPKKLRYAQLILNAYKSSENSQKELTINQFVEEYASKLEYKPNPHCQKERQLQMGEYSYLKDHLLQLTQKYQKSLEHQNSRIIPSYKEVKSVIMDRQEASVQSMQHQVSLMKHESSDNGETKRVKTLLKNGMWGCLDKLNERLAKLEALQHPPSPVEQ